jgi:protein required for attachment to host cells
MENILQAEEVANLVLFAPPKALGQMRSSLSALARGRLALSVDKDITKETPAEIDKRLRDARI